MNSCYHSPADVLNPRTFLQSRLWTFAVAFSLSVRLWSRHLQKFRRKNRQTCDRIAWLSLFIKATVSTVLNIAVDQIGATRNTKAIPRVTSSPRLALLRVYVPTSWRVTRCLRDARRSRNTNRFWMKSCDCWKLSRAFAFVGLGLRGKPKISSMRAIIWIYGKARNFVLCDRRCESIRAPSRHLRCRETHSNTA